MLLHSCNCDELQGGCCYVLAIGWLELVQNKRERSMVMLLWGIVLGLCAAEYVHHEAGLQGCRAGEDLEMYNFRILLCGHKAVCLDVFWMFSSVGRLM